MGKFTGAVRGGKLRSPLHRDFDAEEWLNAVTKLEEDVNDQRLGFAGVIINQKHKRLWNRFNKIPLRNYSGKALRRSYVAVSNRDFATLRGKVEAKAVEVAARTPLFMDVFLTTKIRGALDGKEYAVDDLAASGVDGLHTPLKKSFLSDEGVRAPLDIKDIRRSIILGQIQSFIVDIWEDCLWRGNIFNAHDTGFVFVPGDEDRARMCAIGYARSVSVTAEMNRHGLNIWRNMNPELQFYINSQRRQVSIVGTGQKTKFEITSIKSDPDTPVMSFLMNIVASEMYFKGLFECEFKKIPGVSPKLLLSAWEVLYSMGESMARNMPTVSSIEQSSDFWKFAPTIPKMQLYRLVSNSLSISFQLAKSIIDFLTFTSNQSDELWARPFVQIDEANVSPILTCLNSSYPLRMIERWMKYGGIDLQERGVAFEQHAREYISKDFKRSGILKNYGVLMHRFKMKSEIDDPGDIDLIVWFGDTILLGEVKCTLYPTRASEFHNYFETLNKAGRQIMRKTTVFKENVDAFWQHSAKREPSKNTQIIPFILTNLTFGVGSKFSNVPVTDLLILGRFIGDGFLERFITFDPSHGHQGGEKIEFYKTAEEAESVIGDYLINPPQLQHFRDSVKVNHTTIPPIDDSDLPWQILDYSVQFDSEILEGFRQNKSNQLKGGDKTST